MAQCNSQCALTQGASVDGVASGVVGLGTLGFGYGFNGTTWDRIRKDTYAAGSLWTTTGGSNTQTIPTGAANTVVKNSAGRLVKLLVTTTGTGTGNVTCYDNASSASGTIIGIVPANATVTGNPFVFDNPAANGITCANVASGPVFTVSYY